MKILTALAHIALAFALAQSVACASAEAAKKDDAQAKSARAGHVQELNALVAQGPLFFDTNTDMLTEDSQRLLTKIAAQMHRVPEVRVLVAGNADERGDTAYNLALGERRGYAAREYLMRLGIPKERVKIVSLGEEQPIAAAHNESAWAKNRRDEFTFLFPEENKSVLNMHVETATQVAQAN